MSVHRYVASKPVKKEALVKALSSSKVLFCQGNVFSVAFPALTKAELASVEKECGCTVSNG